MGFILTGSTYAICPHGAVVQNQTNLGQTHRIHGHPIWVISDVFTVVGCPLPERPCQQVTWHRPSATLFLNGSPVLTTDSSGMCTSAGPVTVINYQTEFKDKEAPSGD